MTTAADAHVARVLLLLDAFSSPSGETLDGLTKLAKLDFLLRYPAFLDALRERLELQDDEWQPAREAERLAVADPMVRYKYGPWDDRYYPLIGSLVGRGLAEYSKGRGRVALRVTDEGHRIAVAIRHSREWQEVASRIAVLRRHFDLPGSQLKTLIYDTFPGLARQSLRSGIAPSPGSADDEVDDD